MKIIYVCKPKSTGSDDTEGHVQRAFESLGHEVIRIDERQGHKAADASGDLLLFHKWDDPASLVKAKCPKAFWYFDKVEWNDREKWMGRTLPLVDYAFLTDETWVRKHKDRFKHLNVLRQGIGDTESVGTPRPRKWPYKVSFLGSLYGERKKWSERLQGRFGGLYGVANDVFNQDLFDFCATVPIIVAPPYPSDDHYWSNRIYLVTGSGGLMVHPRLKGLAGEYEAGRDYVAYTSEEDMHKAIDYLLSDPAECDRIRSNGTRKTRTLYNMKERCRALLKAIRPRPNTGTKG